MGTAAGDMPTKEEPQKRERGLLTHVLVLVEGQRGETAAGEERAADNLVVVLVAAGDGVVVRGQMRVGEAERAVVELEADAHAALVALRPRARAG